MIEISTGMLAVAIIITLMIGASGGFGVACIIRAAKDDENEKNDDNEKNNWDMLVCMVKCKDRISPTQLIQRRLALIGKKEYLKLYENHKVAYSANGEPIDDN